MFLLLEKQHCAATRNSDVAVIDGNLCCFVLLALALGGRRTIFCVSPKQIMAHAISWPPSHRKRTQAQDQTRSKLKPNKLGFVPRPLVRFSNCLCTILTNPIFPFLVLKSADCNWQQHLATDLELCFSSTFVSSCTFQPPPSPRWQDKPHRFITSSY